MRGAGLGIAGLRADQGRSTSKANDAHNVSNANDASKARHASNARDVGNARRRQTASMTFVARRSSMAA